MTVPRRSRLPRTGPRSRAALMLRDGGCCVYCGVPWQHGLTLDHIEPLSAGGADVAANLATACAACNMSKGRRPPLLWLAEQAALGRRIGWRADADPGPPVSRPPRGLTRHVAFVPIRLLDDHRCSHKAFRAFMVLSTTADREGWCWPNGRDLARLAGRDARYASLTLGELERLGYIERHHVPTVVGPQLVVRLLLTSEEAREVGALPPLRPSRHPFTN